MSDDAQTRTEVSRRAMILAALAAAGELAARPTLAMPGRPPAIGPDGPAPAAWWPVADGPVTPLAFGGKGDGTADDTAALVQALGASDQVEIPDGKVFACQGFEIPAGKTVRGGGTLKLAAKSRILLSGDGITVSGVTLQSDNALYLLHVKGRNVTISQCRFGGSVGHYILIEAPGSRIERNVFDGSNGTQITSVVFSGPGATDGMFRENRLSQYTGFGVQTRLGARNVAIVANTFDNRAAEQDSTVAGGQGTLDFQPQARAKRWGALVNGKPAAAKIKVAAGGPAVTLAAAHAGDKVTLLAWAGYEPININSGSSDITVDGNTISGSGDSGIVLGSDYRGTTLDAKHTTSEDYPRRVRVTNNTIESCAQAGIAGTCAVDQVEIANNRISDYGLGATGLVYPSGIVVTGGAAKVSGNTITSNGRTTRFGINLNGFLPPTVAPDGRQDIVLTGNRFQGQFDSKYAIPNLRIDARKHSIVFTDVQEKPYPEAVRLDARFMRSPPSTTGLAYAHSGEGWVGEDGSAVMLRNGSYADIFLKDGEALAGGILTVAVWARADAGQPVLSVFTALNGREVAVTCPITSRDWQLYRVRVAITPNVTPQPVRIRTAVARDGVGHFRDIAVTSVPIPT